MRACLSCLLLGASFAAHAAAPLKRSEEAVINFGFATQLGSGIYSVSGRTLQVYRLPFGYALPAREDARIRPRLTLPLTVGFLDFKARDVVDSGLPEGLDTISVVPGIALDIDIADDWQLEPFAEAGIARDREYEIDQRVYSLGLRSYFDFSPGATDWQLYNELVHVVVEQRSFDRTDDFTRLRIGTTARRPLDTAGTGRRADFLAYGLVELFTDSPVGPAGSEERGDDSGAQFEIGITFGATEPLHLWKIKLPRVGLGYRMGEGLSAYRIVFGSPY
jgi:hypothetical protein